MQYIKTSQVKRTNGHPKTEHHDCLEYDSASIEFRFQKVKIWWILYIPYFSLNTAGLSLSPASAPNYSSSSHHLSLVYKVAKQWQPGPVFIKIPSERKMVMLQLLLIYCQRDNAIMRFMTSSLILSKF